MKPKNAPYEHPEDKANRERCEDFTKSPEGQKLAEAVIGMTELWALILTYADSDAHEQLVKLREAFWTRKEIP